MTLETVWSDYRSELTAFLRQRLRDPADVDDVLQEVLLKTHQSLPQLRDGANLKAWLYQIARNAVTDHYRIAAKGRDVHPGDLWYEDDEDSGHAFEACVAPFIAALPDDAADLLTAVDLRGEAQKDYAAAQGIPYSTLKSRVKTARGQLRKLFDDCCRTTLDAQGNIMDYAPKSTRCGNC